jgi:type IV secretion system protein TrbL
MLLMAEAAAASGDCSWWNLACEGSHAVANAGMSAITKSIASGAETLMGEIVKTVDQSATVPLSDPTYRHVYFGFLGLAGPLIGVVLCIAVIVASVRRDPATLGRATVGIAVASLGGALYIVLAQLLIAIDDWLSHGVVEVTGHNLADSIDNLAMGFHEVAGAPGEIAGNALLLILMLTMLIAGLLLWFVLILRKVAILVVVAFAPLLIAGYLWAPTRAWVRKLTEVLIALVFTKTAIYTLFGVGLALLSRGSDQTISDLVAATVLMCGACFAPLVMLRLVHFAADTQLAGDAIGTLKSGAQPVTSRLPGRSSRSPMSRHDFARSQGQAPSPDASTPVRSTTIGVDGPNTGAAGAANSGTSGSAKGAASGGSAAGGAASGALLVAEKTAATSKAAAAQGKHAAEGFVTSDAVQRPPTAPPSDSADGTVRGPSVPAPPTDSQQQPGGGS